MLALTLKQPWASAIAELGKDVENRSWTTPYRGHLAIHAGLSVDRAASGSLFRALRSRLPHGCVVAVVELRDVVRDSTSAWADPGGYHWVLDEPVLLGDPVPCRGRQSLFRLPEDVERAVLGTLVHPLRCE